MKIMRRNTCGFAPKPQKLGGGQTLDYFDAFNVMKQLYFFNENCGYH